MRAAPRALRVLLVEDDPNDAELVLSALQGAGYEPVCERVDTVAALRTAIAHTWDVVVSDYGMPQLEATRALEIVRESGRDIPFIVISGTIGEEVAVQMMRAGARDYILKHRLTSLPAAVEREIHDARGRALDHAQDRVRRGLQDVSTAIMAATLDARHLAEAAAHTARELLGVDLAVLYWWNERAQRVVRLAEDPADERIGVVARPGADVGGVAFQRREPVVIDDLAAWPHTLPEARGLLESAAAVPVVVGEHALGALVVLSNQRRSFTPEDVADLSLLASQAAPGIQSAFRRSHDPLTGLPNRASFRERVVEMLRVERIASIVVLDIDEFKAINQAFGHAAGDLLLTEIAARLERELGVGAVYRIGADEFACIIAAGTEATIATADRLSEALTRPFVLAHGQQVVVGASVGIASYPDHAASADELLRAAETAEYTAERAGMIQAVYRVPSVGSRDARALTLLAELPGALERRELTVHYQRQVDLSTGALVGVEALVRWRHPSLGLLPPSAFLPAAEQTPLMRSVFDEVMRIAFEECRVLLDRGISVALNVSMSDLRDPRLPERVRRRLDSAGCPDRLLTLEITEGLLMADPESARAIVGQLGEMGVRIALDDFGTGYSSMAYLQRLALHELKLDRTFVNAIPEDRADVAIVRATIDLARGLGMTALAEGVERPATAAALLTLGCDRAQGFFYGHPVAIQELLAAERTNLARTA